MALSRGASLWTRAQSTAIDVPRSDETPVAIANWDRGHGVGMDTDAVNGTLTTTVPGNYLVMCSISFIGTTGITYFFELGQNDIGHDFRATADGVTGASVNVSVFGVAIFEIGDTVSLYVYADEDGEQITIVDAQLMALSV